MALQNQFSKPIPGSIPVIIQQFKSSLTRFVFQNNVSDFRVQSPFYEHIIRNEQKCYPIADYFKNIPRKMEK